MRPWSSLPLAHGRRRLACRLLTVLCRWGGGSWEQHLEYTVAKHIGRCTEYEGGKASVVELELPHLLAFSALSSASQASLTIALMFDVVGLRLLPAARSLRRKPLEISTVGSLLSVM